MAVNVGSLLVSLGLDSGEFKSGLRQAEKEFRRSTKSIEKMGSSMQRVGRNLSLAITAPLTALGVASVKAASDAAELQSAFNQTFGAMADDMTKWADKTGDAMGRSTQEIQKAANTFGIFFNQAAPTKQAAAELSQTFAVLAQDLSSFFNTSPDEALQKLRSGLSGESEPLRDFGVFLNEATVGQKALQMGLAATTKELTDQDKILARANLILEATVNAQGDVARTSDGTANRIRAAKAAFEEMSVAIGQKLIPALTPLIQRLTDLLNGFNKLSPGVQTAIVVTAGLAAAMGPLLFVIGGITKLLAPFIAGVKIAAATATAAGVSVTGFSLALNVLRASLLTLLQTLGPIALALGVVAGAIYIITRRSKEGTVASAEYAEQQKRLGEIQGKVTDATNKLASATGKAREEALANARALRQETIQYLANARAALEAARAKARQKFLEAQEVRFSAGNAMSGGSAMAFSGNIAGQRTDTIARQARTDAQAAQRTVDGLEAEVKRLNQIIAAPAPSVSVPSVSGTGSGSGGSTRRAREIEDRTSEIERRYLDELDSIRSQVASAESSMAKSADERAELELRQLESAKRQTLRSLEADEDYSDAQKARVLAALDGLEEAEKAGIEFRRQGELERERTDLLQIAFDSEREQLALQADVADTQAERKRLAMQILALEQEYRRNMLEMVIASEQASDAEKARAQAILDSLAAIEAGERASVGRANETELEALIRSWGKSPEQLGEARVGIGLDGLNSLVDGLARIAPEISSINDAFKAMRDVFQRVIQDMISSLIRLQLQKALAGLLGGGGAGSPVNLLAGIPGYAKGVKFAPGGLAIVGERGPELVNLPRGSQVVPNNELRGMGARAGDTWNVTVNGAMNDRDARRTGFQIASAASQRMAQARRAGVAG